VNYHTWEITGSDKAIQVLRDLYEVVKKREERKNRRKICANPKNKKRRKARKILKKRKTKLEKRPGVGRRVRNSKKTWRKYRQEQKKK